MASPDLKLALYIFQLESPQLVDKHAAAEKNLHEAIVAGNLASLYKHLVPSTSPKYDAALVERMEKANLEKETELGDAIKQAEESEDDTAVMDAWTKFGDFFCEVADFDKAEKTLRTASEKTASIGPKIDLLLKIVRMGLLYNKRELIAKELDTINGLIERGGDWERKNKYKTYKGLHLMSIRQFDEAAELLIDSFATFTCNELISYEEVVGYGVVCGSLALDRVNLKKKIVDSPEALSLLPTSEYLEPLGVMTNALYTCDYATFLQALAKVELQVLRQSPYLAAHSAYYVREMRSKAYSQMLESYMSLSLQSMADSFGVSVEFLETDLARLIPQKKVNCVVDKVNGVIVTSRPDNKNAQYRHLINRGDALLTKLQKYSAAVRLYGSQTH